MPLKTDNQKYILITGTSTGIGRACVIELAKHNYKVFATVRNDKDFDELDKETNDNVIPVMLDVTDEQLIEKARAKIEKMVGEKGLFALVNNAAYMIGGALECHPIEELKKEFEVNVFGAVRMTQTFLPLIRNAGGRIINIGSINGLITVPMLGSYCATKHALEAITESFRLELSRWNIPVTIIDPNIIQSPGWDKAINRSRQIFKQNNEDLIILYGELLEKMLEKAKTIEESAKPPLLIANTLLKALNSKKPKPRYLPGFDTKLSLILPKLLPRRLVDKLLLKEMGIN